MPNGAQIHTSTHSPKAVEDVDMIDVQIKVIFSIAATPQRTRGKRCDEEERWEDDE